MPVDFPEFREGATFVIAASDSVHKERADYVCDGTDDDVQIQAAIDALPASGGKIVLLEGNFLIGDEIDLVANLHLMGSGWSTILKAKDSFGGKSVLFGDAKASVHISDLAIDGNFANNARNADLDDQNGIRISNAGADHCTVENCYIFNCPDNGVRVSHSASYPLLINNRVEGAHWHSLMFWMNVTYGRIINNFCDGSDLETVGVIAVERSGTKHTIVANNVVINAAKNSGASSSGIHVVQSSRVIIESNIVLDTGSGVASSSGIYVQTTIDEPTLEGTIIANNIIETATWAGIKVWANSDDIIGLIISGNRIRDATAAGIDFYASGGGIISNVVIDSNDILNNGEIGIKLNNVSSTIENFLIVNNLIDTHTRGIRFAGAGISNKFRIEGNMVKDASGSFIRDLVGSGHLIAHNLCDNCVAFISGDLTGAIIYRQHSDLFMDVLAVSATHVRANEDLSAGIPITFTIDAQPDVPRTLSGHFDAHAQITEYDIEIIGVDAKGNTITETKDETDLWDWETDNAFATITSIKMTARTGTGAADTMDIGITDVLGLSNIIYATGDVYKIKKNNANATVATAQVNATYDTYDMAVIGLAVGDDFTLWFKSNLNIIV